MSDAHHRFGSAGADDRTPAAPDAISAAGSDVRGAASANHSASACHYLRSETTAHRAVVSDLRPAQTYDLEKTWWCRHPFHGIELKIGLGLDEAVAHCRACTLPDHGAGPSR